MKDKSHFMWFATRAGFDRYDGKNIRHYTLPQTKDSRIFGLATSPDGDIWGFSSHGNLYYYDKNTDSYNLQLRLDSLLQTDEPFIFKIYVDTRNCIWICSSQGLYCYFPQEKKLSAITDLEGNTVYEINELEAGRYALFTGQEFYLLKVVNQPFKVSLQSVFGQENVVSQIRTSYYDVSNKEIGLGILPVNCLSISWKTGSLYRFLLEIIIMPSVLLRQTIMIILLLGLMVEESCL